MPNNSNLNNYKQKSMIVFVGEDTINRPENHCVIFIFEYRSECIQIGFAVSNSFIYRRRYSSSTNSWSNWTKLTFT